MASVYLTGDVDLARKLRGLKAVHAKAAIRKGTRAGSKDVQAEAKRTVPVRTGALRRSIKVRALKKSRRHVGHTVRLDKFYGAFLEYGTKRITPREFLKQAAASIKDRAFRTALDIISVEITKRMTGPS